MHAPLTSKYLIIPGDSSGGIKPIRGDLTSGSADTRSSRGQTAVSERPPANRNGTDGDPDAAVTGEDNTCLCPTDTSASQSTSVPNNETFTANLKALEYRVCKIVYSYISLFYGYQHHFNPFFSST